LKGIVSRFSEKKYNELKQSARYSSPRSIRITINHVNDTDRDIIEQVRAGNTRRYAALVDRHKDRAFTLAVRLTGNKQESEELVQDAFLRAFKNLDQFRGDAKFATWFYRILYNLCMTKITRRRRARPEALDVEDGNGLDKLLLDDTEPSIQERLEEDELQEMMAAEIKALPEKYGAVITLFYVQEMSYEEIVAVLNSPIGTVKTNLFRARNLLKERVLGRMKGEMHVA
jgi:RNA polymerase sigma-70 factor (ECF subfamily)